MSMKKTFVLTSAAAVMAIWGSAASAQTILKVHHFLPAGSNAHVTIIAPWCDKVEKESKGDLKCQIYPAMQLGGTPPQLFDQARDGVADIVWTVPTYVAGRFVKSEVFELPFMATTARQGSRALYEYTQKYAMDEYKGVKPLFMHTTEGYAFHSSKPINKLEDLKGMKIRTATRISARMVASLGGTPVQMPLPQIADALSKGVVDGALAPWEALPATKLHEIAKYHTEAEDNTPRLANTIFIFGMNEKKYDSLTPAQKKVIDNNSGLAASEWAGKSFDDALVKFRDMARAGGNKFIMLDSKEIARWEKATANQDEAWVKEVTNKGADGKKLLSEARALLEKYKN